MSNAVDILRGYALLCKNNRCKTCPLKRITGNTDFCQDLLIEKTDEVTKVVEEWNKSHVKSRGQLLKEIFPNLRENDSYIDICPLNLDKNINCDHLTKNTACSECKRKYFSEKLIVGGDDF